MKRRRLDIRSTILAAALVAAEITPDTAERIAVAQQIAQKRIRDRWCREYSFAIQAALRDLEIRRCFHEDTKRGIKGSGHSESDRGRTEKLKRKIWQYDRRNRAYHQT